MTTGSNDPHAAAAGVHEHGAGFVTPPDPLGRPVNGQLMSEFIGAAFDGCTVCQDAQLTLLVEDAATSARVVEAACMAVQAQFGGIPSSMTDPAVPGTSSLEFRQLAAAGIDGNNEAMFRRCEQMTPEQRRDAVNTAADQLVGMMMMPGGGGL